MDNVDQDYDNITKKLKFTTEEKLELFSIIEPILTHDSWIDMQNNKHHLNSRANHCIEVCCKAWRRARKSKRSDEKTAAIGGLLHDFFFYDWQREKGDLNNISLNKKIRGPKMHGFTHPLIALDNAYKIFPDLIDGKIEDVILKHMWPLTIRPPRCREAWYVCLADKSCSLNIVKRPKEIPHYLGIKKRIKN